MYLPIPVISLSADKTAVLRKYLGLKEVQAGSYSCPVAERPIGTLKVRNPPLYLYCGSGTENGKPVWL